MEFSVLIVFLVIFIMKSYIDKTYINDFLLVMGPYVFIVFINNVFMTKALGFYEIKKSVLEAVLFAECASCFARLNFTSVCGFELRGC